MTCVGRTMRKNAALMQHHDIVVLHDFIDEVRGPEHRDAVLDQPAHVGKDASP